MAGKCLVACLALVSFISAAEAEDNPPSQLAPLVHQGEGLMARALVIAQSKPETQSQVDAISDGPQRQWEVDDDAYQAQLGLLLDQYRTLSPDMREGVARLVRFANYAFNGLTHLTFCENAEADWDLAIAAQFLEHARLAAKGRADPDWHPDLQSDPKTKGNCR